MLGEDEDEVIREVDVYLSDDLPMYLLQFPLKPIYADSIDVVSARFKPQHKKVELEIPFALPDSYDDDARASIPTTQKYSSSMVAQDACLGSAIIKNNVMYISPIDSTLQMRPSFKNVYSYRDEVVESMSVDEELDQYPEMNNSTSTSAGSSIAAGTGGITPADSMTIEDTMQQVQLKRKESERAQSARIQSYAHIHAQEELEPWQELEIHGIGSTGSELKFTEMYKGKQGRKRTLSTGTSK